jgi:hypothetical protein
MMTKNSGLSWQTRQNWIIDAAVFIGAVLSLLTGIYFLFLPSGGYQGGRNPAYNVVILFGRQTWDDLHTWGGILMIAAVVVHFAIHWEWVKMMARRVWRIARGQAINFSRGAKINVAVDLVIALSFLATAVSGIYFLFLPHGFQGGRQAGWDPGLLFSRTTWDLVHTWGAVVMVVAAMLHFVIHWRWIANVTRRFFLRTTKARAAVS